MAGGFPTTCDDKGVTDQDSCTDMCTGGNADSKAKGVWLGNGPGVCTCTGCLFCSTCANPKPDPADAAPAGASLSVCVGAWGFASVESQQKPSEGLQELLCLCLSVVSSAWLSALRMGHGRCVAQMGRRQALGPRAW